MIRFNQPALNVIDQLFSNTMREANGYSNPANIYDQENAFVIEISVPGFKKEDIHINLEQQILKITAEAQEHEVQDEKFLRREFSINNLNRSFSLPKTVDADNITADYNNGILKVTLPRKEEAIMKKQIAIS